MSEFYGPVVIDRGISRNFFGPRQSSKYTLPVL